MQEELKQFPYANGNGTLPAGALDPHGKGSRFLVVNAPSPSPSTSQSLYPADIRLGQGDQKWTSTVEVASSDLECHTPRPLLRGARDCIYRQFSASADAWPIRRPRRRRRTSMKDGVGARCLSVHTSMTLEVIDFEVLERWFAPLQAEWERIADMACASQTSRNRRATKWVWRSTCADWLVLPEVLNRKLGSSMQILGEVVRLAGTKRLS